MIERKRCAKVYVRFEDQETQAKSPILGPYEYIQMTRSLLRVFGFVKGKFVEKELAAHVLDGSWLCRLDKKNYTDVVIMGEDIIA